ncbi:male sterility protein-domain-containing protein [Xylariaceae sp. FL0804]|nr:male sterility protein-domain-containing protein [Xylariaceae sp. FL0804]
MAPTTIQADAEAIVAEYTAALQSIAAKAAGRVAGDQNRQLKTVVFIGSTGSLGSKLVAKLLSDPSVSRVFCLNRSDDARDRQLKALAALPNGQQYAPLANKIRFLTSRLGQPRFGLTEEEYGELRAAETDAIVLNAWGRDFDAPVRIFEPFFHTVVEVARLAVEGKKNRQRARVLFVSSLAAVATLATSSSAPEARVTDPSAAAQVGYGQSKLIAERLLASASHMYGIPTVVVRMCHIIGDDPGAATSDVSWLAAIVKTAATLQCIPSHVAVVDWVRVGTAAEMIQDFLEAGFGAGTPAADGEGGEVQFYHISNPQSQPWEVVVNALRGRMDGASVVPLVEWVRRLRAIAHDFDPPDVASMPALRILAFLDWFVTSGAEKSQYDTRHATAISSAHLAPLDEVFMEHWLGEWRGMS